MYGNFVDKDIKEYFSIKNTLSMVTVHPWAESLKSVTNSDVADIDVVEARIELQINIFRTEWMNQKKTIPTAEIYLYLNLNLHTVRICNVRIRDRV